MHAKSSILYSLSKWASKRRILPEDHLGYVLLVGPWSWYLRRNLTASNIRTEKLCTFSGPDISTARATYKELVAEMAPQNWKYLLTNVKNNADLSLHTGDREAPKRWAVDDDKKATPIVLPAEIVGVYRRWESLTGHSSLDWSGHFIILVFCSSTQPLSPASSLLHHCQQKTKHIFISNRKLRPWRWIYHY